MRLTDRLHLWWQIQTGRAETPFDRDVAAWGVSLAVHAVALLVLTMLTLLLPGDERLLLSASTVEVEPVLEAEHFHFSPQLEEEIGAWGQAGAGTARLSAPTRADVSEVMLEVEPTTQLGEVEVSKIEETLLTSPDVSEELLVKGVGSVGTSSATGAIDRITHEIMLSLDQRATLVVWLFDQSGSLRGQREDIVRRFDRVYDELGVIEAAGNPAFKRHKNKPLLTAVASFASDVQELIAKPTDDVQKIKAAIRAIEDDPSGRENVFTAIRLIAQKHRHYRLKAPRRNVMIVVFTDEAGDDVEQLDEAVDTCRKYEMPVYVVGVPAPFGREQAYVRYVDPNPNFDQRTQWIPVHQGPESLFPERIKLSFSGAGRDDESLDSGFGPFALTRLTYETGGIYFMVHAGRAEGASGRTPVMSAYLSRFFDPAVMRAYRPDYVPVSEYQEQLRQNQARAALVRAAQLTWMLPMQNPRLVFPKLDEARFARDLSLAQRHAAELEPLVARVVETLAVGESDRTAVVKPRWQAGYDLAMGRALAVAVRTRGYNAMLAQAKQGLAFQKRSDTWRLVPSDNVTSGSVLARQAERAQLYLQRVLQEHPDTPWAFLAARELETPLGWEWREQFRNLQARAQRPANGNARNNNRESRPPGPPARPLRKPPAL